MDVDGHALDGVDDHVGAGSLEGLGDLSDVDRRHLHEQRLISHLAAGGHDGRGALGRGAHGGTAGGDARRLTLISSRQPRGTARHTSECADKLVNGGPAT